MLAKKLYRALLRFYPAAFREEYGNQMTLAFTEQLENGRRASLWARAAADVVTIAPREHLHVILQDLRYAVRVMRSSPTFTFVAILSLALGIGANTALFGLWNSVLHAELPVRHPEELVLLSDPGNRGVSIGLNTGVRTLLTFAEYEQIRDGVSAFSGVMASESSLGRWEARFENGELEEIEGRLVSGGFFEVLGVLPLVGRTFSWDADRTAAPYAVLGYNFWQGRFNGDPGVVGKHLTIRGTVLTIIGIMPPGFIGETAGQEPELWMPLTLQPSVLPGRDQLHDIGYDKVMWLHVFGRLRPGASLPEAEAQANAVFKAGLDRQYGSLTSWGSENPRDQRLVARPGASGASSLRTEFSNPLTVLLLSVGVLLLIACANLASLLLARGAAWRNEIALRLSLGASRGRLIRQLITESVALAAVGGVAGFAAAYSFHIGLVQMIRESEPEFRLAFRLDPEILGFTLGVTAIAALFLGLLPALQATRPPSRFAARAPWGRVLVSAQLALALPLLFGAGLLARTLYNLEHVDLGYPSERMLITRINTLAAGYNHERALRFFEDLRAQFQRIPGVTSVGYSKNGVFGGRASGDDVEVEGFTSQNDDDRYSAHDGVGPRFFSSIGVPFLLGRDITEADRAGGVKVCIINEAFARKFFPGRNPIGMHVTNVDGPERETFEVVGVIKTVRLSRLRGQVPPVYWVPFTQPLSLTDGAIFALRTAGEPAALVSSVRETIRRADPAVSVLWVSPLEERIGAQLTQDRVAARLSVVFGGVALVLAAIGLYGVLSYGVVRRKGEIAIRIALGARAGTVIGMILRETAWLVAAGLVLGGGLAYAASRMVATQLFGVAPHDPWVLGATVGMLLLVTIFAAYLPARQASRLDPMTALRTE